MGRFGTSVAQKLAEYGHDVLVIDKRADRIEQLRRELPHLVQLDATNADALAQIGIGRFQTALVCMSSDFESTLLTTVLLLRAGVATVIVKARTHTQEEILKELGAHQVVLPEHEVAEHLVRRLALHNFVDYLDIGDGISIIELLAPAQLVGKSLAESDLRQRHGLTVIAVRREHELISNTGADFRIQQNDELLVVGRLEDAERLEA
jgi:trk system potassium uptake protein TrkA